MESMKILGVSILLVFVSVAFGQNQSAKGNINSKDSVTKFSLSFSTFNHAERIFDGTTTFLLTASSVKVTKRSFGGTKSKTVYSKKIPNKQLLLSTINKIGLDSLKNFYFNYCVMVTSGNEYFLDFTSNSTTKSIRLHHYYLKQLDDVIQFINANLPKRYQFQYLPKNTTQDCSLW
jgi:hypothetical protein